MVPRRVAKRRRGAAGRFSQGCMHQVVAAVLQACVQDSCHGRRCSTPRGRRLRVNPRPCSANSNRALSSAQDALGPSRRQNNVLAWGHRLMATKCIHLTTQVTRSRSHACFSYMWASGAHAIPEREPSGHMLSHAFKHFGTPAGRALQARIALPGACWSGQGNK